MDERSKPEPGRIEPQLPAEMARALNLIANPLAGVAAMTAISLGMASQVLGMWVGAMSGAVAASRQLAPKVSEALEPVEVRLASALPEQPAPRKADVLTLIKDARTAVENRARTVAEAAAAVPQVAKEVSAPQSAAQARAPAKVNGAAKVARKSSAPGKAEARAIVAASAAVQPKAALKPRRPDDLKAISGIGPKLEQVLNGLGIWTYRQVAAMTAGEIEKIEDRLGFKGRIGRDDWIGQAKALMRVRMKA